MTTPVVEVTESAAALDVVAGVDTHADSHHVAVLDMAGRKLGDRQIPTTTAGYESLRSYLESFGHVRLVGIEGTSSYGAGLARYLRSHHVDIREIIRPRRSQRRRGKSDPIDAYAAAQQALAEPESLPQAKTGDGIVEQIRVLLTVRRSAVKARVAVVRQIKSLLVTASEGHQDSVGQIQRASSDRQTCGYQARRSHRLGRCCHWSCASATRAPPPLLDRGDRGTGRGLAGAGRNRCSRHDRNQGVWRDHHGDSSGYRGLKPGAAAIGSIVRRAVRSFADPRILGKNTSIPTQPWRRPTGELGSAPDCAGPSVQRSAHEAVLSSLAREREVDQGRASVSQTRDRPRSISPARPPRAGAGHR